MSSGETSRGGKTESSAREREWKSQRDPAQNGLSEGGSLRSRIGDKDSSRMLPHAPPNSYRPEPPRKDEDRDSGRKRTLSGTKFAYSCQYDQVLTLHGPPDREKDIGDTSSGLGADQATTQPPKRPRINRNRYTASPSYAVAKRSLPIDPQAADKTRSGTRKD
jgi:THO complex subunit 2